MKHTYIYLTLLIAATFSACTSGFEELNIKAFQRGYESGLTKINNKP